MCLNGPAKKIRKPSIKRLFSQHSDEFQQYIEKEKDLSVILLKSHLLIEYYLDHLILLLKENHGNLRRIGFYEKLQILEKQSPFFKKPGGTMLKSLYALNNVRNNLAHQLNFEISQSELDAIGYEIGREYIIEKYKINGDRRKLLLWLIKNITGDLYFLLAIELRDPGSTQFQSELLKVHD